MADRLLDAWIDYIVEDAARTAIAFASFLRWRFTGSNRDDGCRMRRKRGAGSGEDCDAGRNDDDYGDREVRFVDTAEYSVDADGAIDLSISYVFQPDLRG